MKHNSIRTRQQTPTSSCRGGFTLVEMLISVTLVLLMMTMFVSIFQLATDSVHTQQGIARHHQKARAFLATIRHDMSKRTMRLAMPYHPGESTGSPTRFTIRQGYFHVSTNDPDSTIDDVLQFTISINNVREDTDDTQIYGSARTLYDVIGGQQLVSITRDPNQPDADDGVLQGNSTGASTAAEVMYFVRNGNLYRRVMLLRNPLNVAGGDLAIQPESTHDITGSGQVNPYIVTTTANEGGMVVVDGGNFWATNDLWKYFDYSAVRTPTGVSFVGVDSLDNSQGPSVSIGNPGRRFGFDLGTGLPREFTSAPQRLFFGRFLHAETSARNFNYPLGTMTSTLSNDDNWAPGDPVADLVSGLVNGETPYGNPLDRTSTSLSLDQETGILSEFTLESDRGGVRTGEDLLLTNVHGMKVELWDGRLGRFVEPGHQGLRPVYDNTGSLTGVIAGDYHANRRMNTAFGDPDSPQVNIFDTWHPDAMDGTALDGTPPPFMPLRFHPPRLNQTPDDGPTPTTAPDPASEMDPETDTVVTNRGFWQGSEFNAGTVQTYDVGDIVFARPIDLSNTGDWWTDHQLVLGELHTVYRCKRAGFAGDSNVDYSSSGRLQPAWPTESHHLLTESTDGADAYRTAGNTIPAAYNQPAVWESLDNRRPLKAIRVTIQLYEPGSDTLRQVSVVLPLTKDADL